MFLFWKHSRKYLIIGALLFFTVFDAAIAQQRPEDIRTAIEEEKQRAQSESQALGELTQQERGLHKDLAEASREIKDLEIQVAEREAILKDLQEESRQAGDALAALTQKETEARVELERILDRLWHMHVEDMTAKAQGLPDWAVSDRKYIWTARLYEVMDSKLNTLRRTREETAIAESRREDVLENIRRQLAEVNAAKDSLLKDRLRFQRRLGEVRKEKLDREERLNRVLATVEKLNYTLSEALKDRRISFAEKKGVLPWPAEGKMEMRFDPDATPPARGVGIAVSDKTTVRAVSPGKVVHDDVLRGFGRVIILLHEEAYYSLYAFLADSRVEVGEEVEQGGVLGEAGYYPQLQGPGLYFELRFHQKVINPEIWLASR